VVVRKIAIDQAEQATGGTGVHLLADFDLDRFRAAVVGGEYPQVVSAGAQVATTGDQWVVDGMAVAGGGVAGQHRGLDAGAAAHACMLGGLQRGHVGDALQLALFQVQAPAVDGEQHEQQAKPRVSAAIRPIAPRWRIAGWATTGTPLPASGLAARRRCRECSQGGGKLP
jgi:hypothetical protein